jgi:hypothetical protein
MGHPEFVVVSTMAEPQILRLVALAQDDNPFVLRQLDAIQCFDVG